MSGEMERSVSGWTVDTLRLHLLSVVEEMVAKLEAADTAAELRNEQRFIAQQQAIKDALISQKEAVAAALVAAEKAVLVAETNAEKWRGAANEWRGAMNDRERNLMPRTEAEQASRTNAEKVEGVTRRMDKSEGFTRGLLMVFAVVAMIGVLVGIYMSVRGH